MRDIEIKKFILEDTLNIIFPCNFEYYTHSHLILTKPNMYYQVGVIIKDCLDLYSKIVSTYKPINVIYENSEILNTNPSAKNDFFIYNKEYKDIFFIVLANIPFDKYQSYFK